MIQQIIMWRVNNPEDVKTFAATLATMKNKIPSLHHMEIHINERNSPSAFDLCFISQFKDQAALSDFEQDPLHQQVVKTIKPLIKERTIVQSRI